MSRSRVRIPLARTGDLALIDPSADARIRAHLTAHPDAIDRYTGRCHRVALVSDASALPLGTNPAAALVGMESAAAFLHHHSGLDVTPLPVDARHADLADTVAALGPGFTAVLLQHTRAEYADAVRRRLSRVQPHLAVLDTGDDAIAVTVVAALLNAVRQAAAPLSGSRVLIVGARTAPGIGALLAAAGARDLTFADGRTTDVAYDVLIDLSVSETDAPAITLAIGSAAPEAAPTAVVATGRPGPGQLHPLLALPGLLSAVVHGRVSIDVTDRLAAAHALAGLAAPGRLLPDALDTRLAATIYAAVTALQPT